MAVSWTNHLIFSGLSLVLTFWKKETYFLLSCFFILTSMKTIKCIIPGISILGSETVRIKFIGFWYIRWTNQFFPLFNSIFLREAQHNNWSTGHVCHKQWKSGTAILLTVKLTRLFSCQSHYSLLKECEEQKHQNMKYVQHLGAVLDHMQLHFSSSCIWI